MRLNSIEMQHLLSFQCGCCCFINVMSLFKRFQVSFSKVLELITRFQANVLYLIRNAFNVSAFAYFNLSAMQMT